MISCAQTPLSTSYLNLTGQTLRSRPTNSCNSRWRSKRAWKKLRLHPTSRRRTCTLTTMPLISERTEATLTGQMTSLSSPTTISQATPLRLSFKTSIRRKSTSTTSCGLVPSLCTGSLTLEASSQFTSPERLRPSPTLMMPPLATRTPSQEIRC